MWTCNEAVPHGLLDGGRRGNAHTFKALHTLIRDTPAVAISAGPLPRLGPCPGQKINRGCTMATLLDLVRQRRAELEAAQLESPISDERCIGALMALAAKAEEGDETAKATMEAVKKLFARSNRPQKP
jgi:hypothetical protein